MKALYLPYVVFILSHHFNEAEEFAAVCLSDRQGYTFIEDAYQMRGLKHIHYVRVGQWARRDDLTEIELFLRTNESVDITLELPSLVKGMLSPAAVEL